MSNKIAAVVIKYIVMIVLIELAPLLMGNSSPLVSAIDPYFNAEIVKLFEPNENSLILLALANIAVHAYLVCNLYSWSRDTGTPERRLNGLKALDGNMKSSKLGNVNKL